jgi:glucosamine--fructose-6-phosphate aminotransferase (isomerizing)
MSLETHMAREIAEAGAVVARQLRANASATARIASMLRANDPRLIATIARGSSDHAALYLKHAIEISLGLPCASLSPSIASLYHAPLRLDGAFTLTLSQSGRSPDIVTMQAAAKKAGAFTLALVNDAASPAATGADALLPLHAGEERAVAATKSMIATLVAGLSLIAEWRDDAVLRAGLLALPSALESTSAPASQFAVDLLAGASSAFVLGRGATFGVAAEAALKLKETSAIHAEAFSSAEVLHGPAGLVRPGFPVIAFMPADAAREGMIETIARLRSFGAVALVFDTAQADDAETIVAADAGHPLLTPIPALCAFYRLAEAVARRRGRDPDSPPHLSKVTRTV